MESRKYVPKKKICKPGGGMEERKEKQISWALIRGAERKTWTDVGEITEGGTFEGSVVCVDPVREHCNCEGEQSKVGKGDELRSVGGGAD